jgi:hypothetical protein
MKQWDPKLYKAITEATINTTPGEVSWHSHADDMEILHRIMFHVPETTNEPLVDQFLKLRLLAHALISALPSKGLLEVCEAIAGIYQVYLARTKSELTVVPLESHAARLGQSYQRPSFQIAEE